MLSLSHRIDRLFAAVHRIDEFELSNEDAATLLSERLGRTVDAAELAAARVGPDTHPPLAQDVRHELCAMFDMPAEYLSVLDEIDDDTQTLITELDTELRALALWRDHQVQDFRLCSRDRRTPPIPEDKLSALIAALESSPAPSLNPTRKHHLSPANSATPLPTGREADQAANTTDAEKSDPNPKGARRGLLARLLARLRGV